jgi:4-hydroxythreonine-4-phosphate dehydrogenase
MMMEKPIIAITMGDAAGIGPELIVKLLSDPTSYDLCRPFVVGDPDVMETNARIVEADLRFRTVAAPAEASFAPLDVDVLCPQGLHIDHIPWGSVEPAMGQAAALCLRHAFELAMQRELQGVVSAPLNKEAFHLAGYPYLDELAYLGDLTASPEPFILGAMDTVWTVAVTEHIPFREILERIKTDAILDCILKLHGALQRVLPAQPRIAVAALNVHAGEGGLFGREELDEIQPAVDAAHARGIDVAGPIPADMVFVRALQGDFDGVVCMYHDQANIARKLQPKNKGATLFMGLPVICGTTAHGTAFDIAGKGIADPGSLAAALKYTAALSSVAPNQLKGS